VKKGKEWKIRATFDANAIVNLATLGGSKAAHAVEQGFGLALTFFEIANSVWKLHSLLKKLSNEEAEALLEGSLGLFYKLNPLTLNTKDAIEIEKLAKNRKITFYDSCYAYASKKNKAPLVTDDEKLARVARNEGVEVLSSLSLI
jgi:predicted nucleic acid-binding protein